MTQIDNRLGLVAALGVTFLAVSCDELPDTHVKPNAGQAGTTSSGAGSGAGGKAGSGGTGSSGTAGKGSNLGGSSTAGGEMGGTGGGAGSSNAGKGGTAGAGGSGTTDAGDGGEAPGGAPSGAAGDDAPGTRTFSTDRGTFFGASRCATANVQLCEDFESGSLDTGLWTPRGAAPEIDDTLAARGSHSAHFHTDSNGLEYITQTATFPAPNNTYFARMFVWFDSMPTAPNWAHWTVSAAMADDDDFEVRVGGQYSPNADKNLFGVGSNYGATGDWMFLDDDAGPAAVPVKSWVCLEWMHQGDTNETKLWWDGVEHPSLATTETNHGGESEPYTLPAFDSMWVGWWLYQEDPAPDHYDVWIDEIAVDYARIGCDI